MAIIEVFALMRRHGLLTARQHDDHIAIDHAIKGISQITDLLLLMDKEEQNNATLADAREHIFSAQINVSRQLDLIHRLSGATRTLSANEVFVFVDFPNEYPGQLESLVFPKYYTACFSTNCSNSSMWGHYSDSHRGVCLIFNVQPWNDGLAIKLRRVVGTNSQGPFLGEAAHPLHHVQYQTDYPEIDFFALFGMLPIPIINSDWYHDRQKNQTTREDCTTVLTDERHRAHWRQFERIFSTKTNDWAYEEETRITMQDYLLDLESPTQRLATYEFSSLHGIVFGINTCTDDKMKIIDIISTKCLETKRRDFKFYQAFYSSATAKIELSPLSLISFENKPQQQPKT